MAVTSAKPARVKESRPAWMPPIRQLPSISDKVVDSGADTNWVKRLLLCTPSRGTVTIEWHAAVNGCAVPANWSMHRTYSRLNEFFPVRFTVPDAQNLCVGQAVAGNFEWLLFLEDDVIPPTDLYVRLDEYMREGPPVVSGLYYLKANPTRPLVYRGLGCGEYLDWKFGDKVWVDGVPTGCLLIHMGLLRAMWEASPEYEAPGGIVTRRVFDTPARIWVDDAGNVQTAGGTSDLNWCQRVIQEGWLKKSGWDKYARKRYPFLIDTNILCRHVSPDGSSYP